MRHVTKPAFAILALNEGHWVGETKILEKAGIEAFKALKGVYKGQTEESWVIILNDQTDLDIVRSLAHKYNQESILVVAPERSAQLEYTKGGKRVAVGKWTSVPKNVALKENSYSFDENTDTYYICR